MERIEVERMEVSFTKPQLILSSYQEWWTSKDARVQCFDWLLLKKNAADIICAVPIEMTPHVKILIIY